MGSESNAVLFPNGTRVRVARRWRGEVVDVEGEVWRKVAFRRVRRQPKAKWLHVGQLEVLPCQVRSITRPRRACCSCGEVKNLNSVTTHRAYGVKYYRRDTITETGERQPRSVFYFGRPKNNQFTKGNQFHPTEKPVALFEYLVKTYSNEGDVVLDPFAGSGTTALACTITNRRYICIERESEYVDIARRRLADGVQAELCIDNVPHRARGENA